MTHDKLTLSVDLDSLKDLNHPIADRAVNIRHLSRLLVVAGFPILVLALVGWLNIPQGLSWSALLFSNLLMLLSIVGGLALQHRHYDMAGLVALLIGMSCGALLATYALPVLLPASVLLLLCLIISGYAVLPILNANILAGVNVVLAVVAALLAQSGQGTEALVAAVALSLLTIAAALFGGWIVTTHRTTLQMRHRIFRMIIDTPDDMIFLKDRQSRLVINNRFHAVEILGAQSPAEAAGLTDFDFPPSI